MSTLLPARPLAAEPSLDDDLMAEVARGSEAALEALVARHRDRLVRLSARLIRDRSQAEDIAQETFIRLLRHAPGYEARGQFSAWLQTIARRLSLNILRTRQRRPEVSIEAALDRPSRESPEKGVELKEVRRALAMLPERQRRALWLKAARGFSYRQIAETLNCSESDVANAIFRGRETLSKLLAA